MHFDAWCATGARIRLGGHDVFVRSEGTGDTILFLHGFPTSSLDFAGAVTTLKNSFRCLTFDFLGFGNSDKPDSTYSYQQQTDLACAVAEHYGVSQAFVVAHDYGVSVGQELLARHAEGRLPFALAGITFMNGGLTPSLHRPLLVQRLLASPIGFALAPLLVNRLTLRRSLGRIMHTPEALDIEEHWKAIAMRGGPNRMPALLGYIRERRMFAERWSSAMRNATVPLSFAWGLRDPISGPHMLEWARSIRPDAAVLALDEAGHYPQLEQETEVTTFVKKVALLALEGAFAQASTIASGGAAPDPTRFSEPPKE